MKVAMTRVTDGIVSGYDGTPGSTDAVRWAAREAWARDTTLTVCTSRPYSPASKIEAAGARQGRLPGSRRRQRRLGTAGRVLRGARGPPPAARSRRSSPQSGAFVHSTAVRTWRSGYTFDARRPPARGRRSGRRQCAGGGRNGAEVMGRGADTATGGVPCGCQTVRAAFGGLEPSTRCRGQFHADKITHVNWARPVSEPRPATT